MDTSPKQIWNIEKLILILITLLIKYGSCETYYMEDYCNKELSFISQFVDQIKFELNDDGIYDRRSYPFSTPSFCTTTFEAWYSTYPKLMFYFEDLNLDCDKGHLEFYTGESSSRKLRVTGLESNICGNDKPEGVFTVDSRYFRIKYVPAKSQVISDVFTIIVTTYADDSCPSYAYKCDNSRCIDKDIKCNGYDSCGDGSGCDLEIGVIIGIAVGSAVGLALIISTVICCLCCLRKSGRRPGTVQNPVSQTVTYSASNPQGYSQAVYGVNQASFGVNQSLPYPTNQVPYPAANNSTSQQPVSVGQNYSPAFTYSSQGT